jgi:hypothetical protein
MQSFVADLQEKRLTNGTPILERLATDDPAKLVEAISRFAPKDVAAKQWEARITMEMRESAPAATPDEIEQVLRSGFAR